MPRGAAPGGGAVCRRRPPSGRTSCGGPCPPGPRRADGRSPPAAPAAASGRLLVQVAAAAAAWLRGARPCPAPAAPRGPGWAAWGRGGRAGASAGARPPRARAGSAAAAARRRPAAAARAAGRGFGVRKRQVEQKPTDDGALEEALAEAQKVAAGASQVGLRERQLAYGQARKLMRRRGIRTEDYARICSNLGTTNLELEYREKAAKCYAEALVVFEECGGHDSERANCAVNLARAQRELGDVDGAESSLKLALKIHGEHLDTSHAYYLKILRSLSVLYRSVGRVEDCKPLAEEELRVHRYVASLAGGR